MVIMMELRIREILCYMLCCFCVNMVSGVVNLTASGYFTDSTYVVQKGSSLTLTCSNDNKATSVTISDKDGAALGTCTVFLGAFTCSPSSSYTVDATDASVNYFNFVLSNFQTSNCGTYKCEMATDPTVFSSINVEQEVYYDDPCGTTCGTCEVNTFDCQATTNKCVCKGNTNPDPDDKTKCFPSTTTSTTSTTNMLPDTNTTHPSTSSMTNGTSTSTTSKRPITDHGLPDWAIGVIAGGAFLAIVIITIVAKKLNLCCFKKKDVEENQTGGKEQSANNIEQPVGLHLKTRV